MREQITVIFVEVVAILSVCFGSERTLYVGFCFNHPHNPLALAAAMGGEVFGKRLFVGLACLVQSTVHPSKQSIGTWNQSSFTNEGEDLPIIQFRVAELLLKREKEGNSSSRDQIDVLDENPFYIDNNLQQVLK